MKKRMLAGLLALMLAVSALVIPAGAADTVRFSDVKDKETEQAVETLRLMGVLSGYGDGTFRPAGNLTRAQFCKMAVYIMAAEEELGQYRTVTVFPDVKPSHWAAQYINLAAKGKGIIAGFADGKFHPERTITVGQAVTILLRLLGYKDEDIGGVWPDSYMAKGAAVGLTEGIDAHGNTALTRAQAAKLFLNLLETEKAGGGTLYTIGEETELHSIDAGAATLKTADGKVYPMAKPFEDTMFKGAVGRLVFYKDKVLTFLPSTITSAGLTDAAVVVYADRSAVGFGELAGNNTYQIYKNGIRITSSDLRKNDVAIYRAETNSILVSDTRVAVYYEACEPNPNAPAKIRVLGGTELRVLPTAMESVAQFKPGDQMILLLTADGQVAGAVDPESLSARSNAVGIVDDTGVIRLLCGGSGSIQLAAGAEAKYHKQVVRISANTKDRVLLGLETNNVFGELDVIRGTLDGKALAENVMIFDGGQLIGLHQLPGSTVSEDEIQYARTNWAGKVDLIVLAPATEEIYGRVVRTGSGDDTVTFAVEYGPGQRTSAFPGFYLVQNGDYAAAKINHAGTTFTSLVKLNKMEGVARTSWIGETAVNVGGRTYYVPKTVLCYNLDNREWIDLETALAYADTVDLYEKDGTVRVVEVKR